MSFIIPLVTKALAGAGVGSLVSGSAAKAFEKSKTVSTEVLGYDFVGLITKLAVYFVVAWFAEKYIWWVQQKPINQVLSGLFGALGGLPTFALSQFLINLTDENQATKLQFWDIVKGGAVALTAWEAYNYYTTQERLGGKASPLTLGVFGLIIAILGITSLDLIKKIQEMNIIGQIQGNQNGGV